MLWFEEPSWQRGSTEEGIRGIPVRRSLSCVLKGDWALARWRAVREWPVVRAGAAQFQEHC